MNVSQSKLPPAYPYKEKNISWPKNDLDLALGDDIVLVNNLDKSKSVKSMSW